MSHKIAIRILCLCCLIPLTLHAQCGKQPDAKDTPYKLQPGDSFEVFYRIAPEYNQTVSVLPDGTATLQLTGSIVVQDKTVQEVSNLIEAKSKARLTEPKVTVEMKDYVKPHFTVLGEVGTPGHFELRGPLTVQDGLAIAGGFKVSAKHTGILLISPVNATTGCTTWIDYRELERLKEGKTTSLALIALKPGDLIIVPTSKLSKVERYVKLVNTGIYYNPGASF